jgi:hypothetical protein
MSELQQNPSTAELCEKIARLEKRLDSEIDPLKERIMDLREALESEVTNTTEHVNALYGHIKSIYQFLTEIHDLLWPLVHKMFPGFTETWKQWDSILKNRNNSSSKDRE